MEFWQLLLIIGLVLAATAGFIWNAVRLNHLHHKTSTKTADQAQQDHIKAAEQDVEHIFNDEFREELRNRGRLHFEKIIGESAMFLQQDLRLTTSQLNDYMKQEVTRTLQEEFAKYEQSITDAKQLAIDSLDKTREAIEQQRQVLGKQLQEELQAEKQRLLERFEKNMSEVVNHYLLAAIGDQISLDDQLEYILGELDHNKTAILEDIKNGA